MPRQSHHEMIPEKFHPVAPENTGRLNQSLL
jgi:hypothetical protein